MSSTLLYTVLTLSVLGTGAAVILYFVAQKFKVIEDARIDSVQEALPGANCGGCGYAGCRVFAETCVKNGKLDNLFCPVGGNEVMAGVASILGLEAIKKDPRVAVIRCNGTCDNRLKTSQFDGVETCAISAFFYSGETGCQFGCLGYGDCYRACKFDAIVMHPETGIPEIIDEKCTSCGACVAACPKNLIELRKKGPKDRKIYVSCRNTEKGGVARKSCKVACIGCSKCLQECRYDAIVIENNLAFIDSDKCKLCRKCVSVCPTNSIIEVNFPPRKITSDSTTEVITEKS